MSKKLVAYFSATEQTKKAAEEIAKILKCDLYEIKPKEKYTGKDLDYTKKESRSAVETHDRNCRPELADKNANISNYDTILVGFPIWWDVAPNVVLTFLEAYDFTGKKVVVWGTSQMSGIQKAADELKKFVKGANVVEGLVFDKDHRKASDYEKLSSKL